MFWKRLSCAAAVGGLLAGGAFAQEARYRVHFNASWSAATHPGAFPVNAHFSPLIGASHNDQVTFWEPGGLATPGIESMAETGATSTLGSEFTVAMNAGNLHRRFTGTALFGLPTTENNALAVSVQHPRVTAVTMIAPSPDWFLGVNGVELFAGGVFLDNVTVDLYPWDAGTDSGLNFTSANSDTNPAEPIRSLAGEIPFAGLPPMGSFTFILLDLPCPGDTDGDGDADLDDLATVLAGFGLANGAVVADGDVTNDRAVTLDDLAEVLANFGETCMP